jgi:UDP-2,3-diacylglucosamine hydrolase
LNNLTLRGDLWIASDIHLGADIPNTAQAFYDFLALARRQAQGLILCGDIFDAWIGDDHALHQPPDWLATALTHLRQTAHAIPVYLSRGNRDFLMGDALAAALGAHLLPAPVLIDTRAGVILLAHGDEYCTDDLAYQRFRQIVHTAWIQQLFLSLPLSWRRAIADWARARSRQARHHKPMQIMDVNPQAVCQALRSADSRVLIHGHTHQPALHTLTIDGQAAQRWVLPDWDFDHDSKGRGGWISISQAGIQAHHWPPDA